MKKNFIWWLIISNFFLVLLAPVSQSFAEEPLLDNELELKTSRLNKEQTDDGKAKNFVIDDRLFNEHEMDKMAKAKKLEEQQRTKEKEEFFLNKTSLKQELNTTALFANTQSQVEKQAEKEETKTTVSSVPALWPILVTTALITVVILFIYYSRKRGTQNGRKRAY